jgi:hypothetical protein
VLRTIESKAIVATTLLIGMTLNAVHAHDPATLDSLPSIHGGQVRMAGPFHVELVILGREGAQRDRFILVYLQDHFFNDTSSAGLKATVKFIDGPHATTVNLIQIGGNGFSGTGSFDINPSVTAEISVIDTHGELWSASYTPFAVKVRAKPLS